MVSIPARADRRPQLLAEPGAASPSTAADARGTVVFDGMLWNGNELAAAAGADVSSSDGATVALRTYRRFGEGALTRLRGAFALVICDAEERTCVCVRDHAGIHPLFYSHTDDGLLVSPSIEALLRRDSVSPALDRTALAEHVFFGFLLEPAKTQFAAIKRLPPGHVLRDGGDGRKVYRHWDPAPSEGGIEWARDDELEQVEALLAQAVERCLQLGPAGVYLSGGLDSATVAVLAADASRRCGLPAPVALSVLFPDPECDEQAVQRAVGADLGLPHVFASFDDAVGPGGLLGAALELTAQAPVPLLNPFEPAFDHLAVAARSQGCRVLLGGGGGDEWLALDPSYAVDLVHRGKIGALFRVWDAKRRYLPLSPLTVLRNNVWRAGLRPVLREVARTRAAWALDAYRRRRGTSDWLPAWIARDAELRRDLRERAEADGSPVGSRARYLEARRRTLNHPVETLVAEEAYLAGRRSGLRRLEPFWDPDVVDLLYRVHPDQLLAGRREKGLVREVLARHVPSVGREWPKTVFMDSFATSVVRGQGPAVWRALGGASALADLGVVDREGVGMFVERYFAGDGGRPGATWDVWNLLSTETWVRGWL